MHYRGMVTREQIRAARKTLGENQDQFARRFGVDQATVHRWEKLGLPKRGTAKVAVEKLLTDLQQAAQ